MESAKKNFQIADIGAGASDLRTPDLTVGVSDKTHRSVQEKTEIFESAPKTSENIAPPKNALVTKALLINKLNFLNFQDRTILVNFKHHKYNQTLTLHAAPLPCLGEYLDCVWTDVDGFYQRRNSYEFANIMLTDDSRLLLVEPQLVRMDRAGIRLLLPEVCYEVSTRSKMRHLCEGITVQFIQNSSLFCGTLIDFNARSFKIELNATPPQTFGWINPEETANLILSRDNETLYSGDCRIIRHTPSHDKCHYVLEPLKFQIQRFKQKEYRSERQQLNPTPDIVFIHPFTNKMTTRKVTDISGSGFAVEEDKRNPVLLPGMIIPELELNFANSLKLTCRAQVVYQIGCDAVKHSSQIKCGLAILDMDIQQHARLIGILDQAKDANAYVCNPVDLDNLWDFFFETGFIYPDKYALIQENKNQIKETYEKIYNHSPHIGRHFIHQENGRIMGHMAMIRFFEKTWLIHHHAARKSALNKAGLMVLSRIGRLSNDSHRLYSLHMDYCMCYFRPENRFPNRVFGGAAKAIKNCKRCSVDSFAFLNWTRSVPTARCFDEGWCLEKTLPGDLSEVESFYEEVSGGLMLKALDLTPAQLDAEELSNEYRKLGLSREKHFFSFKKNDVLKAIILVNRSNLGLNLSALTNSAKVLVLDSDGLSKEMLGRALFALSEKIGLTQTPVLLFPVAYAEHHAISFDKTYNLWILDLKYIDEYFCYVNRLLRFVQ